MHYPFATYLSKNKRCAKHLFFTNQLAAHFQPFNIVMVTMVKSLLIVSKYFLISLFNECQSFDFTLPISLGMCKANTLCPLISSLSNIDNCNGFRCPWNILTKSSESIIMVQPTSPPGYLPLPTLPAMMKKINTIWSTILQSNTVIHENHCNLL